MLLLIHLNLSQNHFFNDGVVNGWFGIPFRDIMYFTHIRWPHLSSTLNLYGLTTLITFYSTIFSLTQIRSSFLRILLLCVMKHTSHTVIYRIIPSAIPSAIPSSPTNPCISNCFTLRSLPVKDKKDSVYQGDPDTEEFIDRLFINTLLVDLCIITPFPL